MRYGSRLRTELGAFSSNFLVGAIKISLSTLLKDYDFIENSLFSVFRVKTIRQPSRCVLKPKKNLESSDRSELSMRFVQPGYEYLGDKPHQYFSNKERWANDLVVFNLEGSNRHLITLCVLLQRIFGQQA